MRERHAMMRVCATWITHSSHALLVENQEQEAENETMRKRENRDAKVASRLVGACELPIQSMQRNGKRDTEGPFWCGESAALSQSRVVTLTIHWLIDSIGWSRPSYSHSDRYWAALRTLRYVRRRRTHTGGAPPSTALTLCLTALGHSGGCAWSTLGPPW